MRREELSSRAQTLLGRLRQYIEVSRSMHKTDPLGTAEDVVKPLLSEMFGLPSLENLSITEHYNFPAIDLGDKDQRELHLS